MSAVAVAGPSQARIARRETLRQLLRSKTFILGALIVGFWVVCALFGSYITPHDPLDQSFTPLLRPGGGHPLGTDTLGRDVLSRVLVGHATSSRWRRSPRSSASPAAPSSAS